MERDFKGIWIPKEIWLNKNINIIEKYYLSIYKQVNDIRQTDIEMLNIISKTTLIKTKKHLFKLKYINKVTLDLKELKNKTIELSHKGKKCEWCGEESYILQKHHYPISAKDGGKEIINICPNCHYTYHCLEEYDYE